MFLLLFRFLSYFNSFFVYFLYIARYSLASAVLLDGSILFMGGYCAGTHYNDVWKSTNGGINWSLVTSAAWASGGKLYSYTDIAESLFVLTLKSFLKVGVALVV